MQAMHGPFAEFAILLLICALAGAVFVRLRQPVLIAYMVVGVLVGPAVLGLVTAHDQIDLLAQAVKGQKLANGFLGDMRLRLSL